MVGFQADNELLACVRPTNRVQLTRFVKIFGTKRHMLVLKQS